MQSLDDHEKANIKGIYGARYVFAVPDDSQDWKMAVLKGGQWYSITYDQLSGLHASNGAFYDNTTIPPVDGARYYIAVPRQDEQWPAPAAIFEVDKWRPVTPSELQQMAGKFSNMPANIQRGFY